MFTCEGDLQTFQNVMMNMRDKGKNSVEQEKGLMEAPSRSLLVGRVF